MPQYSPDWSATELAWMTYLNSITGLPVVPRDDHHPATYNPLTTGGIIIQQFTSSIETGVPSTGFLYDPNVVDPNESMIPQQVSMLTVTAEVSFRTYNNARGASARTLADTARARMRNRELQAGLDVACIAISTIGPTTVVGYSSDGTDWQSATFDVTLYIRQEFYDTENGTGFIETVISDVTEAP